MDLLCSRPKTVKCGARLGDTHGISRSRVVEMGYGGMAGPALFCLQAILLASVPGEGAAPIGSLRQWIGRDSGAAGSVSEWGRDTERRLGLRLGDSGEAADAGKAEGGSGWRVSSLRGGAASGADGKDKIAENGSSAKRAPVVFRSHSAVERENKREVRPASPSHSCKNKDRGKGREREGGGIEWERRTPFRP